MAPVLLPYSIAPPYLSPKAKMTANDGRNILPVDNFSQVPPIQMRVRRLVVLIFHPIAS